MEILFEILFEGVLQLVFEVLAEFGVRRVRNVLRRPPISSWMAAAGYAILGAVGGGLSLLVFPGLFIKQPWARWMNLVVTPVGAGLAMAWIGKTRQRRGRQVLRLDRFSYGALFAFSMALVRFIVAH